MTTRAAAQRAKRHGNDFEYRVARDFGGTVYTGEEGDVEAYGYRFECKYRTGLSGFTLKDFLDQINRYEKAVPDKTFLLAITGGKSYQNARYWVMMDRKKAHELFELEREQKLIEAFKAEQAGEIDRAKAIIVELAYSLARDLIAHGQEDHAGLSAGTPLSFSLD